MEDGDNEKGIQTYKRPQTAKPLSQINAKPVAVKQMVFFDGDSNDIAN